MLRSFVAIPLPAEAARLLVRLQAELPAGHAVPADDLHVTLAFLGEAPAPVVEDVHHALDAIVAPGLAIAFRGIGLYGGNPPRALAAQLAPDPALRALRDKVSQAVRGAGIDLPRARFQPHATFARLGRGLDPADRERLSAFVARHAGFAAGPFPVPGFTLYRSRLGRSGPHYEDLATYPLAAPG